MKKTVKWLLVFGGVATLLGCNYDNPIIFGVPDHIWSRMSRNQRTLVIKKATGPDSTSIQPKVFAHCVAKCKPAAATGAQGIDQICFKWCLDNKLILNYTTTEGVVDPTAEWK